MSPKLPKAATDVRCQRCSVLLAKSDGAELAIRRGEMQVTVTGEVYASIVCYRRGCGTLNTLRLPVALRGGGTSG